MRVNRGRVNERNSVLRRFLLPILAILLFAGLAAGTPAPRAHASGLIWTSTTWVSGTWLCRSFVGGYHCTQHWYISGGQVISTNPAWVPNSPGYAPAPAPAPKPYSYTPPTTSPTPAGISQWAFTGRYSYAMSGSGMLGYPFGQCTWYAAYRAGSKVAYLGNAGNWAYGARSRGLSVGSSPAVGATVVFAPGVQGASWLGHVSHVEAVYSGGWFLVSEMNFYWNGGGWGRVSFRYAHTGPGVSFIY